MNYTDNPMFPVSIHAPVKVRRGCDCVVSQVFAVSIHAPVKVRRKPHLTGSSDEWSKAKDYYQKHQDKEKALETLRQRFQISNQIALALAVEDIITPTEVQEKKDEL